MNRYTGIAVDHVVEVDGFLGARVIGKTALLFFSNPVANGGLTVAKIPMARLNPSLGSELAQWFLMVLENTTDKALESYALTDANGGNEIEAQELCVPMFTLKLVKDQKRFELMLPDRDSEMVLVSMPESAAIKVLGERLCNRLIERGEIVMLGLMRQVNQAA